MFTLLSVSTVHAGAQLWPTPIEQWRKRIAFGDTEQKLLLLQEIASLASAEHAALVGMALDDADPRVKYAAAEVAVRNHYKLADKVRPWLAFERPELRLAAARVVESSPVEGVEGGLSRLLDDSDEEVRIAAVSALGAIGTDAAARALIRGLGDASSRVRRSTVGKLARLRVPIAVTALLGMLADPDDDVRTDSAVVLIAGGNLPDALTRKMVFDDRSIRLRTALIRQIGTKPEQQWRDLLLSLVAPEQPREIVATAADAIANSSDHQGSRELISKWLDLDDLARRDTVARIVGRVPSLFVDTMARCRSVSGASGQRCIQLCALAGCNVADIVPLVNEGGLPTFEGLRLSGKWSEPWELEWVAGRFDTNDSLGVTSVIGTFERLLTHQNSGLFVDFLLVWLKQLPSRSNEFRRVLLLLGRTQSTRAVATLRQVAFDAYADEQTVSAAVVGLGHIGPGALTADLMTLIQHPSKLVAQTTMGQFYAHGSNDSPRQFLEYADRDSTRRLMRLVALGGILAHSSDEGLWPLFDSVFARATGAEQDALLDGISRNASEGAQARVLQWVNFGNTPTRRKIAESIGDTGIAIRAVTSLLDDPQASVRAHAAWSAGRLGILPLRKVLVSALSDRSRLVRSNALASLGRLGAQDGQSIREYACPRLEGSDPETQEVALAALLRAHQRCSSDAETVVLLSARGPSQRRLAAALIRATRRSADDYAIALCNGFETNASVRDACVGQSAEEQPLNSALPSIIEVVPSGPFAAVPNVEFAVECESGLLRFGVTDRRGAFSVHEFLRKPLRIQEVAD